MYTHGVRSDAAWPPARSQNWIGACAGPVKSRRAVTSGAVSPAARASGRDRRGPRRVARCARRRPRPPAARRRASWRAGGAARAPAPRRRTCTRPPTARPPRASAARAAARRARRHARWGRQTRGRARRRQTCPAGWAAAATPRPAAATARPRAARSRQSC
eukprot:5495012-Prymnesium_polylepis.2